MPEKLYKILKDLIARKFTGSVVINFQCGIAKTFEQRQYRDKELR